MPHFSGHHRRWKNNAVDNRKNWAQKDGTTTSVPVSSPISQVSRPPKKPAVLEAFLDMIRDPFASCLGRNIPEAKPVVRPRSILKAPTKTFKVADRPTTDVQGGGFLDMKRVKYHDVVQCYPTLTRGELYCEEESWFSPKVEKEKCFWGKETLATMQIREVGFKRVVKQARKREEKGVPDPWKGLDEFRAVFAYYQPRA